MERLKVGVVTWAPPKESPLMVAHFKQHVSDNEPNYERDPGSKLPSYRLTQTMFDKISHLQNPKALPK
jgi:hypothetical protein